jgi:tRNA-dihydrouridine synthase B
VSSSLWHPLSFGDRSTGGNILCAPLAGYTDIPFRELAVRMGADLTYTEMVSAEALVRDNGRTMELLRRAPAEEEYGIQLFTSSPEAAAGALSCIEPFRPLVIDLNCGCPVPKVIKNGAGAALMKNPLLIGEIVSALTAGSEIPVTVKLRTGWDHQHYTYLEAARRAREAGASLVTLHGRTRSQGYGGTADWEAIATLKAAIDIPVIGNGDIFCAADAERMLTETGCDGVMVARGALGNPFIFREIRALLREGRSLPPPTPRERIETALAHLERAVEVKRERTAVKEMKKQLCAYTKGISGSAAFRNQLVHCETVGEYRQHFADFLASLPG